MLLKCNPSPHRPGFHFERRDNSSRTELWGNLAGKPRLRELAQEHFQQADYLGAGVASEDGFDGWDHELSDTQPASEQRRSRARRDSATRSGEATGCRDELQRAFRID